MAEPIAPPTLVAVLQQLAGNPLVSSRIAQLAPMIGEFLTELQQVTANVPADLEPPLYFSLTEE